MDDRRAVAWIHRRAGFGLHPDELTAAAALGPAAELDRLLAPPAEPAAGDDWDDALLPLDPKDPPSRRYAIHQWLELMVGSTRPLADRMAWVWHGHFVSALDKVRVGRLMVDQIRLFRRSGLGGFADLVSAVAVDPAMLIYLDGRDSTGRAPNENFGRELMELFTLGVGEYEEADVKAGAAALTGWRLRVRVGTAVLEPARHDDTARHYLGVDGVHDLATVVAALAAHPALPAFVARSVATELLGSADDAVVQPLAEIFAASGLRIDALVRATLEAGLAGRGGPVVLGPVPWLVMAQRVTGATLDPRARLLGLRAAGQVPMVPPNVAGWPGGPSWFASATVVARANLAAAVARATADGQPVLEAASSADPGALAFALGLSDPGFGPASAAVLARASSPRQRLALALTSPEVVLA